MKKLLELPFAYVQHQMHQINDIGYFTVQEGLYYLMFIQAISVKLAEVDNDPIALPWLVIRDVAMEHGGMCFDYKSHHVMLYTRLTYLASKLLED